MQQLQRCGQPSASLCAAQHWSVRHRLATSGQQQAHVSFGSAGSSACSWRSVSCRQAPRPCRRRQLVTCLAAAATLARGNDEDDDHLHSSDSRAGSGSASDRPDLSQAPSQDGEQTASAAAAETGKAEEPLRSRANTAMIALRCAVHISASAHDGARSRETTTSRRGALYLAATEHPEVVPGATEACNSSHGQTHLSCACICRGCTRDRGQAGCCRHNPAPCPSRYHLHTRNLPAATVALLKLVAAWTAAVGHVWAAWWEAAVAVPLRRVFPFMDAQHRLAQLKLVRSLLRLFAISLRFRSGKLFIAIAISFGVSCSTVVSSQIECACAAPPAEAGVTQLCVWAPTFCNDFRPACRLPYADTSQHSGYGIF